MTKFGIKPHLYGELAHKLTKTVKEIANTTFENGIQSLKTEKSFGIYSMLSAARDDSIVRQYKLDPLGQGDELVSYYYEYI